MLYVLVQVFSLVTCKVASGRLEADGFPAIGTYLQEGDPISIGSYRRIAFTQVAPRMSRIEAPLYTLF